jgi:hypothetical protein
MSTSGNMNRLNAAIIGATLVDIAGFLVAGLLNGGALAWLAERESATVYILVAGPIAYAVTTVLRRAIDRLLWSSSTPLFRVNIWYLLLAGILNGAVFLGLMMIMPYGRVWSILSGALAYYSLSILAALVGIVV